MDKRRLAHASVLSCSVSTSHDRIAFGTNFGAILVYDISTITDQIPPKFSLPTHSVIPHATITISAGHKIQAMLSKSDFLIIGANGCLYAVKWADVMQETPHIHVIKLPPTRPAFDATVVSPLY